MDKRDTPFIGGLILLVILAIIGTFALSSAGKKAIENSNRQPPQAANQPSPQPPAEPPVNESARYFARLFSDKIGGDDIAWPIEGFDAEFLIMEFPGLTRSDFGGVAAFGGRYDFQGGALVFVHGENNMWSSADQTVSDEGFATLLVNVSARLGMSTETHADIDAIFAKINTTRRLTGMIGHEVSALGVTVVPLKLLEDSRCPIDVTCVWAGTVRVQASVDDGSGASKQTFTLGDPVATSSAVVTLESIVTPEARSGVKFDPAAYIFKFKFEKR